MVGYGLGGSSRGLPRPSRMEWVGLHQQGAHSTGGERKEKVTGQSWIPGSALNPELAASELRVAGKETDLQALLNSVFCSCHWRAQVPCLGDVAPDVLGDREGRGCWRDCHRCLGQGRG